MAVFLELANALFLHVLLPGQRGYFRSSSQALPHHWLVEEFPGTEITIRQGRRVTPQPQGRSQRIAFLGDSITFGNGLPNGLTLPSLTAGEQSRFHADNYGVTGYSLVDYVQVAKRLPQDRYRYAVVTLTPNDAYPASPFFYALLVKPDERITLYESYQPGLAGWVKSALTQYLPIGYAAMVIGRSVYQRLTSSGQGAVAESGGGAGEIAPQYCYDEMAALAQSHLREHVAQQQIYANPGVRQRYVQWLMRLRDALRARGAEPVVILNYSFHQLERGAEPYRKFVQDLLGQAGVAYLDLYEQHRQNRRQCGYFVDPGHPGEAQNRFVAKELSAWLLQRESARAAGR
ncbi:SGNH/GDSL hydrolase family protein [Magnetofaba australis]|uniref:SGNH/GDSL hydrolase family protein n=1 Tax=Magnetofaba australis TaxID=1472297 RepID=UPI00117DDD0A|nr:SGNH/GDSL hydrolase family protein [Magnetofaba australis]